MINAMMSVHLCPLSADPDYSSSKFGTRTYMEIMQVQGHGKRTVIKRGTYSMDVYMIEEQTGGDVH